MPRWAVIVASAIVCMMVLAMVMNGDPFATRSIGSEDSLIVDGDFEANDSGQALRTEETPQGWYESRRDSKEARLQLKLSTKSVGGNATHKAMIKGNPKANTYLTQKLQKPEKKSLAISWDIYVKEIWPESNRSCFQMLGDDSIKGKGPNAGGSERFVFLGFENAEAPGKTNLFAFEGGSSGNWSDKRMLVPNLDLRKWYTITVAADLTQKSYAVSVEDVTAEPIRVRAFESKKTGVPKKLTHVSFASWNDGPGTFYVDNVRRP